jgi:uncharacterized membrane protein YkvA (DUF1232 family)
VFDGCGRARPPTLRNVSLAAWVLLGLGAVLLLYVLAVLALIVGGRRGDARALAGFIPDCVVLVRRLMGDPRVPPRRKLLLAFLVGYLAMPFDLVPDFIPVVGQLEDAIIVALVLRTILRAGGVTLLREHWPGPEQSRLLLQRLAYGRPG